MSNMVVTRLILAETGTYNDMALRPFQSNVNGEVVRQMQEATRGGTLLQPSNLAGLAGSVVRPASEAQGVVSIEQGWGQPRFRFMMEVRHTPFAGGEFVQYLTGYTDHVGVSHGGHLDPNMRLYFNNSIMTRVVTEYGPTGHYTRQTVSDASHIITGDYSPDFNSMHRTAHTMRPEDVFGTMNTFRLRDVIDDPNDLFDTRTTFAQGTMKKSRRSNGSAPTYLSRLMNTWSNTMAGADTNASEGEIYAKAAGDVREGLVSQDTFLNVLQMNTSLQEGSSITYAELNHISPGLDDRTQVAMSTGAVRTSHLENHRAGQTEHWGGTTNETIVATILAHSIPAIMMDLMLTNVVFFVTNQTLHGQYHMELVHTEGFANVDLTPYGNAFMRRLETEVLTDLTHNNQIGLQIQGHVDVLGESRFTISYNSGPPIEYAVPSFADALMAPIITNNADNLRILASDVEALTDNLQGGSLAPQQTGYHHPAHSAENYDHANYGSV